jgi:hypothetical protein
MKGIKLTIDEALVFYLLRHDIHVVATDKTSEYFTVFKLVIWGEIDIAKKDQLFGIEGIGKVSCANIQFALKE